ncbi:transposase [Thiobacter sp. AK1]|uniref:Transposase n=1 Tax=Thiobacter aerophilum TaxID=3121275 RepID=A0ABV0EGI7_9BURK
MRAIFNAPDKAEVQRLLKTALDAWRKEHPKLAEWAESAIPESLTVFDFPASHRVRLRTTNALERYPPGTQTPHPGGKPLPEPGVLPAPGLRSARPTG